MPTKAEKMAEDEAKQADDAAVERLGQVPVFGEDPLPPVPENGFVLQATLVSHSESGGSASGGTKSSLKFEVHEEDLAQLIMAKAIGQRAFDVTFGKADFGDGLTIASYAGRPDENGAGRAWIVMTVPENQQHLMAAIHSRKLTQVHSALVLDPAQVTLDEALTRKAE